MKKLIAVLMLLIFAFSCVTWASAETEGAPAQESVEEKTETGDPEDITDTAAEEMPAETPVPAPDTITVSAATELAVYTEADSESAVLTVLPAGEEAPVICAGSGWLQVMIGEDEGYVSCAEPGIVITACFTVDAGAYAPGQTVLLNGLPEGVEGEITCRWESDDGSGWAEIPGAESDSYSLVIDESTADRGWRIIITFGGETDDAGETAAEEDTADTDKGEVPAEDPGQPGDAATVLITADTPVRVKADGLSDIFAELPIWTEAELLGAEGDWLLIKTDAGEGYVFRGDTNAAAPATEAGENRKVTIFTDRTSAVAPGDIITLTSRLEGYEDAEYILYQWECNDGSGWKEVPGATSDTYAFPFSDETNHTAWRLRVISD